MTALDAAILVLGALFLISVTGIWAMRPKRQPQDPTGELDERLVADLQRNLQ
ncbi:hypothetical protein ACTXG7_08890 [Mycolicibacterium sp. Dal123E01]|uniref:hypothetical protein n=1 Tax=Mycolicibacterium sp. Dal123E01 TaxID=3457578 RepID=UPI00403E38AA